MKLNKTQKKFCENHGLTANQFFGIDKYEGSLTATHTGGAGTKVGLSDLVVS